MPSGVALGLSFVIGYIVSTYFSPVYYIHEASQKGFISASAINGGCAFYSAPGMGSNLVVKVHYRLGSRNC